MSFKGIYPPVNTPFQANGSIGGDGFCVMVNYLVPLAGTASSMVGRPANTTPNVIVTST
ncbi:hypothetical protein NKJ84_28025 [Mesorhizobium sp. M0048]|uniref:hypothetical protein n=1 Tax=Mesorhizobium sp. M0048 TaxID=2956860 RepID=UPI0033390AFC